MSILETDTWLKETVRLVADHKGWGPIRAVKVALESPNCDLAAITAQAAEHYGLAPTFETLRVIRQLAREGKE